MNTDFQYFQSFLFTNRRCLEYVTDKSKSSESIICYMLSRLQKMFRYENLPDSIPRQYLENYLLVNGSCVIAKDLQHPEDGNLYAFVGAAGGEPDIYYRPTRYMVANPALNTTNQYYISTTDPNHEPNAVLIRNDTMWQGLYPMMARYASLIAENLLTIRTADVMLRVLALITAPDDSSRLAADQFLKDITEGHLASIAENRFLDGIRMQNPPSNNGSYLTQFIELHQYLVGSFYNEVGLNANYNMKREALSESETGLNDDSLMPLCEDMLRCRQEDIARVNSMFGTSIQVYLDSSWLENEIERIISLRSQSLEASSQLDNPAPLETGMEDISIEGVSEQGASQLGGDESEEDGEDKRSEDTRSEDISSEDLGEVEDGVEDVGTEEIGEEAEDEVRREPANRDGIEESGEVSVDIDINIDTGNGMEDSTEENSIKEDSTEEDSIKEDSTEEDSIKEDSTEEDSIKEDSTEEEDKEDGNNDSSED